jgi:hypothetical protein
MDTSRNQNIVPDYKLRKKLLDEVPTCSRLQIHSFSPLNKRGMKILNSFLAKIDLQEFTIVVVCQNITTLMSQENL